MRAELKALVAGGVEGLTPDAVALVVTEVVSSVPAPVARGSAGRGLLLVGALSVLVIALGAAVTVLAVRSARLSRARTHVRSCPPGASAAMSIRTVPPR
jgi:type III secretion protein J